MLFYVYTIVVNKYVYSLYQAPAYDIRHNYAD